MRILFALALLLLAPTATGQTTFRLVDPLLSVDGDRLTTVGTPLVHASSYAAGGDGSDPVRAQSDAEQRILAIELLAAAQAYDLQPPALARAPRTDALYRRIRARVAPYADDRPLNGDFAALHTILRTTRP